MPPALRAEGRGATLRERPTRLRRAHAQPQVSAAVLARPRPRLRRGEEARTTSSSRSSTCCSRSTSSRATRCSSGSRRCAAAQRVTLAGSRGHVPGAREVRPRPDRRWPSSGQARPGDRPRRGDPPRDPGALAADEEQPGPDRRAGRRQDRDRRGARAADRRRRRARGAEGQARLGARHRRAARRHEVPRRVRGAAEGRARARSRPPRARSILFIDELHTIVGAGAAEGAVDAANLLKPMLARGELRASARRRSTSTASTSRRTPRSSGASSRSSSASRRSRTRSRSCAG